MFKKDITSKKKEEVKKQEPVIKHFRNFTIEISEKSYLKIDEYAKTIFFSVNRPYGSTICITFDHYEQYKELFKLADVEMQKIIKEKEKNNV